MKKPRPTFIVLSYAFFSACWILFSDRAASGLFSSQPDVLLWVSTLKGWFFVAVTSLLLLLALSRHDAKISNQIHALEESETRFRTIFDSVSDAVFIHDVKNGTILDVSQRACEIFGYTREEITRLDVGALSSGRPPYSQADGEFWMRRAMEEGPQRFEWLSKNREGREFWVDVNIRFARIGSQDVVIVSIHDIDDRKRIQEEVLREKAFTDAVMDSIPGLFYLYDDQGKLIRWNKKHEELTGYTSEELSRMHLLDWYKDDPEEIEKISNAVARIATDGYSESEGHLQRKDGTKVLFYFTAVPLSIEGKNYFTGIGIDITERKRAEIALRESEERYRSAIENISDVLYRTDDHGRLIMVSPSGARLLGYESDTELLGRPNEQYWAQPEKRAAFLELLQLDGKVSDYEVELKRKDGSTVVVSTSSALYRDPGGKVLGVEGIFRDISERKRAEEALRRNEERLRVIFDTSPSSIFLVDIAGQMVMANTKMSELFGYPPEQLAGMNYLELLPPDEREVGMARMQALIQGERDSLFIERQYLRADGTVFWGHLGTRRLQGPHGIVEGLVGIVSDITDRKRMEAALQASHRLTKDILDSMPSAVIALDAQGNITLFNRSAQSLSGKAAQEALGSPLSRVLPLLPVTEEELECVRQENRTLFLEKASFPSLDTTLLTDIHIYPLNAGELGQTAIIIEDVTERTRIEDMMVQTEKMMSVGGLAAGMAHEINNPLGGIVQSTQVILGRLEADSQANQTAAAQAGCTLESLREYLSKREILTLMRNVRESAIRAAHIVASMLEFSRKSESRRAPVAVDKLLDKSVELCSTDYDLKKSYDFRKIEITTDYDPNLPPVPCTATQIEQVFMNLLRNAAQAMRERLQGSPSPRIILRTRREDGFARIDISDNGPGMPEEVRRRVFEPFFSTKPPGEGTGLGLSVSFFIITSNHKGTIHVDSEPGEGTTFTIRLPLFQQPTSLGDRAASQT
ncbi:MAG: PAS domain S-box protein [Desulfovibrio sp.]|nr:PAS domain S-box protein [Desulfovibrio sp.]MBI4959576.1 PAS domain S-box protein [Desulfovibrio sp.]